MPPRSFVCAVAILAVSASAVIKISFFIRFFYFLCFAKVNIMFCLLKYIFIFFLFIADFVCFYRIIFVSLPHDNQMLS